MRNRLFGFFMFMLPLLMVSVTAVAAMEDIEAEVRYLYVQPGQTLHNIVSKLYPSRQTEWPRLRQDIIRINPHAFVDGKESQMKAGVRLELPETRVIANGRPSKKQAPLYVGDVVLARGQTLAVGKNKVSRDLSAGDRIYLGDKLITGQNGFMRLHMIDEALLDLRCYSIMVIEDYALKSANRRSVINLLQGSLRKVTGEIGKWSEDVYELRTPIASVGVRGTEYALRVFQTRGCDGTVDTDDEGMYLKVIKGLVNVHNNKSTTETLVAKGDTLYIKTPESTPEKNVVKPGIISPVVEDKKPEPESISPWWWLLALGLVLL